MRELPADRTGPDVLDDPGLAWLLERARWRLARGWPLRGPVTYTGASPAQRALLAWLLDRPPDRRPHLTVDLGEVDAALRRLGVPGGLAGAAGHPPAAPGTDLEPGRGHTAAAPAGREAWPVLHARLRDRVRWRRSLEMWVEDVAATGTLAAVSGGDLEAAERLVEQACAVLDRLPAPGVELADLAADAASATAATGPAGATAAAISPRPPRSDRRNLRPRDFRPSAAGRARRARPAHALADGAPLARLVLPAAALLGSVPPGSGRRWSREVWAAVGVVPGCAEESVLTLGVSGDRREAEAVPQRWDLRTLVPWHGRGDATSPLRWRGGAVVSVCQHPGLLEAAAAGASPAPLVCLDGSPNATVLTLLRLLARAGARFRVHTDFDWAGVTAANAVVRRVGARPWRLGVEAYERHAPAATERLHGAPVAAAWDATLAQAMRRAGVRVPEQRLHAELLGDLQR